MAQRIVIDPVTRIEGHAKITVQLGDDGQVADARFHVAEFRGFERLGGKKIHPDWSVPGGVREPLTEASCAALRDRIPEAQAIVLDALGRFKGLLDRYQEETRTFGEFPSLFLGLVGHDGTWEHYE